MEHGHINSFRDNYAFLSNFYFAPIVFEGIRYTTNEAAFQAQKCADVRQKTMFANMPPREAKRMGRKIALRGDWEQVKVRVMEELVYAKFTQNPQLKDMLLKTGDAYIEEGNTWGDRTWGTVDGKGENLLGKILMSVREQLAREQEREDNYGFIR